MNILLVAVNYAPDTAGSAGTITGRAEYLASRGHRVTVLTSFPHYPEWRIRDDYRGRLWMRERINGVDVRRRWLYARAGDSVLGRFLLDASFSFLGLSALTFPRPDVVLAAVPSLAGGAVAAVLAARFRVPMGLFVQDLTAEAARQGGMPGSSSVARAVEWAEGLIARRADRVAIITEGFREPLLKMGVRPDQIDIVQNWTATREPALSPADVRARLDLPQDAFIALHAGNMGYKQALDVVLDAAAAALAAHDDRFLFLFVGTGAMREELEARVAAEHLMNVRFLDFQPPELYPSMLGAADVLLLTQRASVSNMSLPGKAASYLASGRPILASVSEDSEIAVDLREIDAAEFAAPEDGGALLAAMRRLEADPARATTLGANGQRWARAHHSAGVLGAALEQFVGRVISGSASA